MFKKTEERKSGKEQLIGGSQTYWERGVEVEGRVRWFSQGGEGEVISSQSIGKIGWGRGWEIGSIFKKDPKKKKKNVERTIKRNAHPKFYPRRSRNSPPSS